LQSSWEETTGSAPRRFPARAPHASSATPVSGAKKISQQQAYLCHQPNEPQYATRSLLRGAGSTGRKRSALCRDRRATSRGNVPLLPLFEHATLHTSYHSLTQGREGNCDIKQCLTRLPRPEEKGESEHRTRYACIAPISPRTASSSETCQDLRLLRLVLLLRDNPIVPHRVQLTQLDGGRRPQRDFGQHLHDSGQMRLETHVQSVH
jgi:hypothetical protein